MIPFLCIRMNRVFYRIDYFNIVFIYNFQFLFEYLNFKKIKTKEFIMCETAWVSRIWCCNWDSLLYHIMKKKNRICSIIVVIEKIVEHESPIKLLKVENWVQFTNNFRNNFSTALAEWANTGNIHLNVLVNY